jgi:hypothetical protein
MEGGIPQEYFLGQKLLNGKGSVSRSIVMVKKPTILKKLAGGVFSEVFPLIALKPLYNRPGLPGFDDSTF